MGPLIVSGNLDSLGLIARFVMTAAASAGLDKRASYRLRQAVDEIATNAIIHGYAESGLEGELLVNAEVDDEALTISLEDTGAAYDPSRAPSPDDLDAPLEQRKAGGLGVYLALNGVDRFAYERVDNRNRNIFIVYRSADS